MEEDSIRLQVLFYRTSSGHEPAREWLKSLPVEERKLLGHDLKTVQYGWPLGMPLIRKLEPGLWEIRSRLPERIARVIFTVEGDTIVSATRIYQEVGENAASRVAVSQTTTK